MSYTVILYYDGIERSYPCDNRFDAIVLADALSCRYGAQYVQTMHGGVLVA